MINNVAHWSEFPGLLVPLKTRKSVPVNIITLCPVLDRMASHLLVMCMERDGWLTMACGHFAYEGGGVPAQIVCW